MVGDSNLPGIAPEGIANESLNILSIFIGVCMLFVRRRLARTIYVLVSPGYEYQRNLPEGREESV